jgi:hypothetical protein
VLITCLNSTLLPRMSHNQQASICPHLTSSLTSYCLFLQVSTSLGQHHSTSNLDAPFVHLHFLAVTDGWVLNLLCHPASAPSTRPTYIENLLRGRQTDTMAFWVYSGGHGMQTRVNLDSLGQLYLIFAAVWTVLLLIGIAFLRNRKLPFLRVRKLPLGILAVCTLHVYWCLCMLAYAFNGFFACSMEYWIMSTYLPIGIALYQASNTQLQHVAGLLPQIASSRTLRLPDRKDLPLRGWRKLMGK